MQTIRVRTEWLTGLLQEAGPCTLVSSCPRQGNLREDSRVYP